MGIKNLIAGLIIERPAKKLTLAQLATNLEATGRQLEQRMASAGDTQSNRAHTHHVIGIERWGQRRLQVALGEPPIVDECDEYQLAPDLNWQELQAEFHAVRQDTIALARRVEEAGAGATLVPHNEFGDLSMHGWLRYLDNHASLESKRIK